MTAKNVGMLRISSCNLLLHKWSDLLEKQENIAKEHAQ
jgi:hypothetical protein